MQGLPGATLRGVERLRKVPLKVDAVLDANGEPQQRGRDSGSRPRRFVHGRMRHARRVCNQAFDPAQRLGERVELQRGEERPHLRDAAAHLAGGRPPLELYAEELRQAQDALSSITGEFTADDLLGVIFSRFCIGK